MIHFPSYLFTLQVKGYWGTEMRFFYQQHSNLQIKLKRGLKYSWFKDANVGKDILKTSSPAEKDGNLLSTTFPGVSNGKESACNAGDLGWIPGLGRSPVERKGYPFQYSGLYSPWGRKESDTTERLSLHFTQKKLKNKVNCLHQPSLHLYSQTQWGSPRECHGLSHYFSPTSSAFHCQG